VKNIWMREKIQQERNGKSYTLRNFTIYTLRLIPLGRLNPDERDEEINKDKSK
jgi:hypothetical protein